MLKVENIKWSELPCDESVATMSPEDLYNENVLLTIWLQAPIFWWLSIIPQYSKDLRLCIDELFVFGSGLQTICFDEWGDEEYITRLKNATSQIMADAFVSEKDKNILRKCIEVVPCGTYIRGSLEFTYREIITLVKSQSSNIDLGYPFCEREWTDLIETLKDIKGVRTISEAVDNE